MSGFAFDPFTGDIYPGFTESEVPFTPSGMQIGGFGQENPLTQGGPYDQYGASQASGGFNPFWPFNNLTNLMGGPATAAIPAVTSVAKGTAGFLNFISDIPRLATTIIGGLMIVAGLFALTGSRKENINLTLTERAKKVVGTP